MKFVHLIVVPYDSAHRAWRMGAGALVLAPIVRKRLERDGYVVSKATVEATSPLAEVRTAFELARRIAKEVRTARNAGRFPLVIAGNCASCLGTISGIDEESRCVIWHDAHGDLNTPETSVSGFLDGMALATATGRCWTAMTPTIPGFRAVSEERVLLAGVRDLDLPERAIVKEGRVARWNGDSAEALDAGMERVARGTAAAYVHVDLDVVDPEKVGVVNEFAAPDGLTVANISSVVGAVRRHVRVAAAALTAYDPSSDPERRIPGAAAEIAAVLVRSA